MILFLISFCTVDKDGYFLDDDFVSSRVLLEPLEFPFVDEAAVEPNVSFST